MNIFHQNHKELAKALLGRSLIVGKHEVVILGARGFPRKDNETGLYRPMLDMPPGQVYCPRLRNALLFLVVCRDDKQSGACVLINEIDVAGHLVKGPGRVTETLGLTEHGATGQLVETGDRLVLKMDGHPAVVRPPESKPRKNGNGLGDEALKRHMPVLVKKYKERKRSEPDLTFNAFVGRALTECHDEAALRRWLRG